MLHDQLKSSEVAQGSRRAFGRTPNETVDAVLAVLSGVPIDRVAARIGLESADLSDAVDLYHAAGYAALRTRTDDSGWCQVRIRFTDWDAAEKIAATQLAPRLDELQEVGMAAAWWFVRKYPDWRLRVLPGVPGTAAPIEMKATIHAVLDGLVASGLVQRWWQAIYEPETAVFGGSVGMNIAHALFHADSHHVLRLTEPNEPDLGRRELSIVLCSTLQRSAGQEWHERGDVWHRVARLRPLPPDVPVQRLPEMAVGLRKLMVADPCTGAGLFGPDGPMAFAAPWTAAFEDAGRGLSAAARNGTLERGLRDVLAHHVIFHWNRLGLPVRTQSILAHAARDAILNEDPPGPASLRSRDGG